MSLGIAQITETIDTFALMARTGIVAPTNGWGIERDVGKTASRRCPGRHVILPASLHGEIVTLHDELQRAKYQWDNIRLPAASNGVSGAIQSCPSDRDALALAQAQSSGQISLEEFLRSP